MEANLSSRLGRYNVSYVGGEIIRAFVPPPLPPDPPLRFDRIQLLLEQASQALGRLDGLASFLPNVDLFIYAYVRKEAVLSSQIEGTQSSLSDLLLFESDEAPGVPVEDAQEVSSYVAALNHGVRRIRDGFPLSLRLFREIHGVLLEHGRGSEKQPGEFRTSQNWIGGTRPGNAAFVPPPAELVIETMGQLELFLHSEDPGIPLLVKAALAHVQFETIHPFLDGNGRVGRLLITLLLCSTGALREPILYLSLFFKRHRSLYYDLLMRVRTEGDWESWLQFFLTGIKETSDQAVDTARRVVALFDSDRKKIESLGRPSASVLRVYPYVQTHPILSITAAIEHTGATFPTIAAGVNHLQELGILREITGKPRRRVFAYQSYLDILNEGAEP